jgi:surfactin synthase thioesterase subunit
MEVAERTVIQLWCIPAAGATAAAYRPWQRWSSPTLTVVPVELPGRGALVAEPPVPDLQRLADWLVESAQADRGPSRVALLGHSMGALVAFEIAHRLEQRRTAARHLIVLASEAPEAAARPPTRDLSGLATDDQLLDALASHPALPDAVRGDREVLAMTLPWLRADLRACETYRLPADRPPLSCPITVITGRYDRTVRREEATAWRAHTLGPFRAVSVPAGHDLVAEADSFVKRCVEQALGLR